MKPYIIIAIVLAVGGAYWVGGRVATERARAEFAAQQNIAAAQIQTEIIDKKREINATVFNTGVADVRRMLRERYTIAE